MRWPLSCGSLSCASTWLRATLLLPWTGWTQPSSAPCPSAASSALPLLWQLANRWVQEEPDIEGQNLSGNVIIVFETWDFLHFKPDQNTFITKCCQCRSTTVQRACCFLIHCLFLLPSVTAVCEWLWGCDMSMANLKHRTVCVVHDTNKRLLAQSHQNLPFQFSHSWATDAWCI